MERAKISVIIPVYNMEKYLKRCMDSVINQTYQNLEIILVNDGSKDSSGRLCDEYAAADNRIKVIHKENAGLGFARNSGMYAATGKYISFLDSDDYISLDMYENLLNHIEHEKADTCIFGYNRVVEDKIKYTRTMSMEGTFSDRECFDTIFLNTLGSDPSCNDDFLLLWQSSCLSLFSLEIIQKNKIAFTSEREFISEDYLFISEYFFHSMRTTILNKAFYFYCQNNTSLTNVYKEDRFDKCVILYSEQLRRVSNYLPDEKLLGMAKQRIQRILLANARYCIFQICKAFPYYRKSRNYIKNICANSLLRQVLTEYPWNNNPFKYRIFNFALQKKLSWILFVLAYFNKMR